MLKRPHPTDGVSAVTRAHRRPLQRRLAFLLSFVFLVVCPPVLAQQPGREPVRINFIDADLRDVIRYLGAVLGLNIVIADVPAARITFSTPNPVPANEVGAVLEAILESRGLVLVQTGPVAQVYPAERRPAAGVVNVGKELPTPLPVGLITQIVPLEFMRADEGVALVRQIASPTARIEVVARSNSILITDRATNVARYLALLRQLDVRTTGEAGLRTYVYRLRHALAAELAGTLAELFGAPGAAGSATMDRARVRSLEDRSLSRTLEGFRRRELESLDARRAAAQVSAAPIVVRTGADTAPLPPGLPRAEGSLAGTTTIVPDPATNSLVIRTAPPNYPVLQETIQQLDIRPAQVLLEVLIAEVDLDRTTEFGIDWSVTGTVRNRRDSVQISGGIGVVPADSLLGRAGEFFLKVVRLNDVDVRAVLRALASRSRVRVLSTPHVLALNNEEARILVGSEVPFSQSTRTGLDVVVDRVVQFRDVGTSLTVIPTINDDGYVTLRILQEVSALTQQTIAAALGAPVITTREAETSAIVRHGQTIVIGGLIGEARDVLDTGIPILRDIPLLGALFRSGSSTRARSELAIFLTPYVVFTDAEAQELLERERQRLRELQREAPGVPIPPPAPPRRRPPP